MSEDLRRTQPWPEAEGRESVPPREYWQVVVERNDARLRAKTMEVALKRCEAVIAGTLARGECAEGWNEMLRTAKHEAAEAFKCPLATEARP